MMRDRKNTKDLLPKPLLSVFALVMINIIAVDSLRTLPIGAKYGTSLLFYYGIAVLGFFVPTAFLSAELATRFPQLGGSAIWVRHAFGPQFGVLVAVLQWLYNLVWYPTILGFVASTLAYVLFPGLENSAAYILGVVFTCFFISTLINCFGMKLSAWMSTVSSILGTLLPMGLIIGLAAAWILEGKPLAIRFDSASFWPGAELNFAQLSSLSPILFGLMGLEMSAVHALDVKNPRKDYPRALLISGFVIVLSLVLSSLAIALVVPTEKIHRITGLIQAFESFFQAFGWPNASVWIAFSMVLGAMGGVSAWAIGPTKALLAIAHLGDLPKFLSRTNRYGAPITILSLQFLIVAALSLFYYCLPSIETSYWILSELTAVLALIMYSVIFLAGIKLRSLPGGAKGYRIPGGKYGIYIVTGSGLAVSTLGIVFGILPPEDLVKPEYHILYSAGLLGAALICCALPWFLKKKVPIAGHAFSGSLRNTRNVLLKARLISRAQHNVSRKNISEQAVRVLYKLHKSGFRSLLVGGGVRDLLLGRMPKDFDVATDAHPEQVYRIFRNCRLIGKRFRLAHIYFGDEIIEVATFRGGDAVNDKNGLVIQDNIYGSIEQDVLRRDFTINALYYDISDFSIIDYLGGWNDLQNKLIRTIGPAKERFTEDPVRIIRAIRLAAKLDFKFTEEVRAAIKECKGLISLVPKARLFEEYLKTFLSGYSFSNFQYLCRYEIIDLFFPNLILNDTKIEKLYRLGLESTDARIAEGKTIQPAFLLSVLLWPVVNQYIQQMKKDPQYQGVNSNVIAHEAIRAILNKQSNYLAIHKRFVLIVQEIWFLSLRMRKLSKKRVHAIFYHQKFRAALDFLDLLEQADFDK
ncbi:MAG: polynucleotide adenylyltransferase PcnB, partial [Gammaproteobacteria bacterium]